MTQNPHNTAYYISLLKGFPPYKKGNKRKPHLKIKHLGNQKVFFDVFIQKIFLNKYNDGDRKRRLVCIPLLPKIFSQVKPSLEENKYIFNFYEWKIVVKKEKKSLQLLSLYPK